MADYAAPTPNTEYALADANDPYAEVNRRLALRGMDAYYPSAGTTSGAETIVNHNSVPWLAPYTEAPNPVINNTGYVPQYLQDRAADRGIDISGTGGSTGGTGGTGGTGTGGTGTGTSGTGNANTQQSFGLKSSVPLTTPAANQYTAAQLNNPTIWNVGENQTVAGQVRSLIDQDSPLMQQARTRALQQMNKRGLMNSSMAIQAGQAAMYDAAMPIAQSDASTYGRAAAWNADQKNVFARDNVSARNTASQFNAAAGNDLTRDTMQINAQAEAAYNKAYNDMVAMTAGAANDQSLAALKNNFAKMGVGQEQTIAAVQNLQSTIQNIQNNTSLSAESKKQYIQDAINTMNAALAIIHDASGLTGDILNFPDPT